MEKTQGCRVPLEAKPVEVMIVGKANDKMLKRAMSNGLNRGGEKCFVHFC